MELKELTGEGILEGVDFSTEQVKTWGNSFEGCEACRFKLNGKTYTALEDPDDGYRSMMNELVEDSSHEIKNTFQGVGVICKMRKDDESEAYDILDIIDKQTNKVILSVGTGNTEDYYPYFVANFSPESMSINQ